MLSACKKDPDIFPKDTNAGADQIICGTKTTLSANTPIEGIGSWTIVSGTGGTIITPINPTSEFTGIAGNSYTLRWKVREAKDDVKIKLGAKPIIYFTDSNGTLIPDNWEVCRNNYYLIIAKGAKTYSVSPTIDFKIISFSDTSVFFRYTFNGSRTYTITGTTVDGCISSITKTIKVKNSPVVDAGADKTITNGTSIKIGSIALPPNNTYSWTSEPTGFISTNPNPTVSPTITTTYILKSASTNCCTNIDKVVIAVQ